MWAPAYERLQQPRHIMRAPNAGLVAFSVQFRNTETAEHQSRLCTSLYRARASPACCSQPSLNVPAVDLRSCLNHFTNAVKVQNHDWPLAIP